MKNDCYLKTKRVTKDKREKKTKKKRIVFETMFHNSFYLTFSKTLKS